MSDLQHGSAHIDSDHFSSRSQVPGEGNRSIAKSTADVEKPLTFDESEVVPLPRSQPLRCRPLGRLVHAGHQNRRMRITVDVSITETVRIGGLHRRRLWQGDDTASGSADARRCLALFLESPWYTTGNFVMASHPGGGIEIRELGADAIELIREIDRSEHIDVHYTVKDGRLQSEPVEFEVPNWDAEGHGEYSSARLIAEFRPIVENGASLLGAFIDDRLAGMAIVDPSFEARTAWFAFLHVSRAYRRRGVAAALWAAGAEIATAADAATFYVSATPSGSALGFYTSRGCRLADAPHPALFAKEPDDIHLICPVA